MELVGDDVSARFGKAQTVRDDVLADLRALDECDLVGLCAHQSCVERLDLITRVVVNGLTVRARAEKLKVEIAVDRPTRRDTDRMQPRRVQVGFVAGPEKLLRGARY